MPTRTTVLALIAAVIAAIVAGVSAIVLVFAPGIRGLSDQPTQLSAHRVQLAWGIHTPKLPQECAFCDESFIIKPQDFALYALPWRAGPAKPCPDCWWSVPCSTEP